MKKAIRAPLHGADAESRQQAGGNDDRQAVWQQIERDDRDEAHHRADRQVDASRGDHQRHAGADQDDEDDLDERDFDIAVRGEIGVSMAFRA